MSNKTKNITVTIIGLSSIGIIDLNTDLKHKIKNCDFGYAPKRCIEELNKLYTGHNFLPYPKPLLENLYKGVEEYSNKYINKNIILLATGDPMWFGLGSTIVSKRPLWSINVYPAISGLQLACAKMQWSIQDTNFISVHGRPINSILSRLKYNSNYIILGHDKSTPAKLAKTLCSVDPDGSKISNMTVMENLGTEKEISTRKFVEFWQNSIVDPWHCIGLKWKGFKINNYLGIEDNKIENDGALTKQSLRILAVNKLRPGINKLLWDIGAGSGGISIEWCVQGGKSYMLEPRSDRRIIIQKNLDKFAINHKANIYSGIAPDKLNNAPWLNSKPDAIFIGGGLSLPKASDLINFCINKLNYNGIILAHALTLSSEETLLNIFKNFGGKLERFESEEAVKYKNTNIYGWNPRRRVLQWSFIKT